MALKDSEVFKLCLCVDGNYQLIWENRTKLIIKPGKSQRYEAAAERTWVECHRAYAKYIFKFQSNLERHSAQRVSSEKQCQPSTLMFDH